MLAQSNNPQKSQRKGMTLNHSSSGMNHMNDYRNVANMNSSSIGPMTTKQAALPASQPVGNNVSMSGAPFSQTQKKSHMKLPGGRSVTVDDFPSDISDDEWGEIQKFGQRLHEEKQRKEKKVHAERISQVKHVLDQQVAVRSELKAKAKQDRIDFDRKILDQARYELEQESAQKKVLQSKVQQQKVMREKMIYEAKIKRDQEKNYHRENERAQVAKL